MPTEQATELEKLKCLFILLLLKLGATSQEIGAALAIDSSAIRRMFPIRSIKKIESIR